jgi:hypothetical protein
MGFIDLAILGCSRLEISFFLLRAGAPQSWFLLLDFPALLAVNVHSPALCHWDLPDTPKQKVSRISLQPRVSGNPIATLFLALLILG